MSIKVNSIVYHNDKKYRCGDIISDITREEAERLVRMNIGIICDDNFKISNTKLYKNIKNIKRFNKHREDLLPYEF